MNWFLCCLVLRNHVIIQYYFSSPVINYLGRLLALKSHDSLITCYAKSRDKPKSLSPLPQCVWPPNLVGEWLTLRDSYLKSHMVLESRTLARSRDNLKTYLHYHNAYVHQTLQDRSLPWRTPTDNVTWSFEVTCQIKYVISPLALDQWITKTIRWKLAVRVLHP